MTHDVFLSYKREDERLAARLAEALETEGFRVLWDRSPLPVQSSREQVQAAREAGSLRQLPCPIAAPAPHSRTAPPIVDVIPGRMLDRRAARGWTRRRSPTTS